MMSWEGTEMTRQALIVAQCVCVMSFVQAQSPQKLSNAELVDKLKRATQGNVVALLDRRENNDLIWKKIK